MILKKKEVIAASLVVLIGLAGYLNWSYQDTVKVRDNESYIQTGKILGEAEMVSSTNKETEKKEESNISIEQAKSDRESARAAAMEALKATSQDNAVDEATRALAGEKLVKCAENIELEKRLSDDASARLKSEFGLNSHATVNVRLDKNNAVEGVGSIKIYGQKPDAVVIGRLYEVYGAGEVKYVGAEKTLEKSE